jgi:hypothetical protein
MTLNINTGGMMDDPEWDIIITKRVRAKTAEEALEKSAEAVTTDVRVVKFIPTIINQVLKVVNADARNVIEEVRRAFERNAPTDKRI